MQQQQQQLRLHSAQRGLLFSSMGGPRSPQPVRPVRPAPPLQILESVRQALHEHRPVVALESTIVAHGMPYPQNLELSRELAEILRSRGVEPATIALRNGICKIGLSVEELENLASSQQQGRTVEKCSTREMGLFLAKHSSDSYARTMRDPCCWGATTVASTMVLAHLAGISTFVTGGVGGVHRRGHETMDVSADLQQLAQTPVVVVSAGIKSILDIPRTLEVLETNGVPTVAYGSDEFPAFFSPRSGVAAPARMDDAATIASAFLLARQLNLTHGILVAVPNPNPAEGNVVEQAIQDALAEADALKLLGRDVTPFLLQRVAETTGGESLKSNMSLVKQNAIVGAEIAIEIAKQQQDQQQKQQSFYAPSSYSTRMDLSTATAATQDQSELRCEEANDETPKSKIVIMGGMVLDIIAKPTEKQLLLQTSNPATVKESDGGVGRNIAEVLHRLGSSTTQPILYTAVGQDARGQAMIQRLQGNDDKDSDTTTGVQVQAVVIPDLPTAVYLAILDPCDGNMHTACADMEVLQHISIPTVEALQHASYLVVDANAPITSLLLAVERAVALNVPVVLEPTSVPKAMILGANAEFLKHVTWATPNVQELCALVDGWQTDSDELAMVEHDINTIRDLSQKLLFRMNPSEAHLIVTMGAQGVLYAHKHHEHSGQVFFERFAVEDGVVVVANTTGAGDTLLGAFLHYRVEREMSIPGAIRMAMKATVESLKYEHGAIAPSLSTWRS